jgi:hypothetical protein
MNAQVRFWIPRPPDLAGLSHFPPSFFHESRSYMADQWNQSIDERSTDSKPIRLEYHLRVAAVAQSFWRDQVCRRLAGMRVLLPYQCGSDPRKLAYYGPCPHSLVAYVQFFHLAALGHAL